MNDKILQYDIVIVGGGAAGLVAAVCCAKKLNGKIKIAVIEKEFKLGKKLLATGNGKCNMTNNNMSSEYYNDESRQFVKNIISKYSTDKITAFWESIGLLCKADSFGRVYPYSGQASAVLDILIMNLEYYNVDIFCETNITSIIPENNGYKLTAYKKTFTAQKVILATGGKVQPSLGSNGSSYKFAADLGLKCTEVFPSLAPIPCNDKYLPLMKGVRTAAVVSLKADGKILCAEQGELQLNEKNISGICIFQLSRFVNEYYALNTINGKKYNRVSIIADLMPDYTLDETENILKKRRKQMTTLKTEELITGIINKKIGLYLAKKLNIDLDTELYNLSDDNIESLARSVKECEFVPSGMSGINSAQVTAGGIVLSEIDKNMQSVKYNNLYIIGEALNVDGMCGGYNLHWAFASGIIAGNAAANSYKKKR